MAWAPQAVGILAALVLAVSAWSAQRTLDGAARAVAEQEGQRWVEATHHALRAARPRRPGEVDLDALVQSRSGEGLRYVGILLPDGSIERESGQRGVREVPPRGLGILPDGFIFTAAPPGLRSDDRDLPPPGPPDGPPDNRPDGPPPGAPPATPDGGPGPGPGGGMPPVIRVEFDGRAVTALRAEGHRLLVIGGVTAVLLASASWVLGRLLGQRESLLRAQARDRQLAVLGEMTAVIAHELRNPLASLKGHAQLLEEGLTDDPKQSRRATRVVREAVRLERLGADLIGFVRAGTVDTRASDVGAILEGALESLDRARVDVERAGSLRFDLDPTKMQQVLANLVDNALQASPEGGRVEVALRGSDEALEIAVRDHGPGVPEEDRERIFEPFVTTRVRGTGLGLAFAKRVVELHGGAISADDAEGGGAVFRIRLPRR